MTRSEKEQRINLEMLSAILFRLDFAGLVVFGVPDDEYDSEARTILARLPTAHQQSTRPTWSTRSSASGSA